MEKEIIQIRDDSSESEDEIQDVVGPEDTSQDTPGQEHQEASVNEDNSDLPAGVNSETKSGKNCLIFVFGMNKLVQTRRLVCTNYNLKFLFQMKRSFLVIANIVFMRNENLEKQWLNAKTIMTRNVPMQRKNMIPNQRNGSKIFQEKVMFQKLFVDTLKI